jgi:hypothetical protein
MKSEIGRPIEKRGELLYQKVTDNPSGFIETKQLTRGKSRKSLFLPEA